MVYQGATDKSINYPLFYPFLFIYISSWWLIQSFDWLVARDVIYQSFCTFLLHLTKQVQMWTVCNKCNKYTTCSLASNSAHNISPLHSLFPHKTFQPSFSHSLEPCKLKWLFLNWFVFFPNLLPFYISLFQQCVSVVRTKVTGFPAHHIAQLPNRLITNNNIPQWVLVA
jgi:hypothetical protein